MLGREQGRSAARDVPPVWHHAHTDETRQGQLHHYPQTEYPETIQSGI